MKKILLITYLTMLGMSNSSILMAAQSLFIGTIQFPTSIKKIPSMRIYYGGHKITGEPNNRTKQLIFSIPEIGENKKFHIVITDSIQFEIEKDSANTVKYMKVGENHSYKCCEIIQTKQQPITQITPENYTGVSPNSNDDRTTYSWKITKKGLDDNRQLPENSIVICFPSNYIERIEGGRKAELPWVFVKQDLLEYVGSEQKLHDQETELLLSAINSDVLHARVPQEVKNQPTKTLVACRTCR